MDLRKALVLSRKSPAQHIETLWETIYKLNVKSDTLTSILAFYMHHRVYPPPVQKAFDTLLMAFTDSKVQKKIKTLLFQTVEEMCHWLNPLCITDTVRMSTSSSVVAELLPCFLINKEIPQPDLTVFGRLISALSSSGLSQDDRSKVLGFLMNTVPEELENTLNAQLIAWLSYSRSAQSVGSLFRVPDITEVDGTPGLGMCTVLSLVVAVTDLHALSLVAFSNIRRYLYHTRNRTDGNLINAVFTYCSSLVTQASKKPYNLHDNHLMAGLREEVLMVMRVVADVDGKSQGRCQLMAGNIQLLAGQLRLTSLMVSVWEYHLSLGDDSALTMKMLTSVIQSDYSQGSVSQNLAWVMARYGLEPQLRNHLPRYAPNILKLIATHPSVLVEEFLDIVVQMSSDVDRVAEVLHCLLDLPMLSATICVHQTALLVQAGFKVPKMVSVRQVVEVEHKFIYQHIMRAEILEVRTESFIEQYPDYWSALWPLLSMGLVQVCSQVTPHLLEAFLDSVTSCQEANTLVLPTLLSRVSMLCPIPAYQAAVYRIIPQYVIKVCGLQPGLLEHSCITQFLSITNHMQLCPRLYDTVVTVAGEHVKLENVAINIFDTLEAVLREIISNETPKNTKLQTSVCTSLAKLSSRCVNLIPRAIASFEKRSQSLVTATAQEREKETLSEHAKELIRILKNPRVAGVVLSPTSKEDVAVAALMRVLFQFLE